MSWDEMKLTAPAKLNLMLNINGRRADGYHDLQTIFQLLDVGDQLTFAPSKQFHFSCDDPSLQGEDNLIVRAVKALEKLCAQRFLCHIHLEKKMPMGGGVGGGSSDAATTLLALNHLYALGLTVDQLAQIGQTLGADVPVFVRGQSAFAQGIGEQLTPISLPKRHFLVVKPDCHVSTAKIFTDPELTRDTPCITMRTAFEQVGHNDCEMIVRRHYPAVESTFNLLKKFGQPRLTGTGACVYLQFDHLEQACQVRSMLPSECKSFVASGTDDSLTVLQLKALIQAR